MRHASVVDPQSDGAGRIGAHLQVIHDQCGLSCTVDEQAGAGAVHIDAHPNPFSRSNVDIGFVFLRFGCT